MKKKVNGRVKKRLSVLRLVWHALGRLKLKQMSLWVLFFWIVCCSLPDGCLQSRHLPTARFPKASSRLSTSFSWSESNLIITLSWQGLLFEFLRLLAIVPASLGFIWCLWNVYAFSPYLSRCPSSDRPSPDRIDYIMASLWVSCSYFSTTCQNSHTPRLY